MMKQTGKHKSKINHNSRDSIDKKPENNGEQPVPVLIHDVIQVDSIDKNKMTISDIINSFLAVLALLSFIISIITLNQMIKDRKASHQPDILINPIELTFSWDSDGNEEWVNNKHESSESLLQMDEDGMYTGTVHFSPQALLDNYFESLPIANIGVGAAKDIEFVWEAGNTKRLADFLIELDKSMTSFCKIGEEATVFSYANNHLVHVDNNLDFRMMYMLPTDEDEKLIHIPAAYSILMHEIIKTGKFYDTEINQGPYIILTMSYNDIMGNKYQKSILLLMKKTFYAESQDGSGQATFQIVPSYAEE